MDYSEDPDLRADGDPSATDPRERCPRVSQKAIDFLLEAESLQEALFDLSFLFRIPVTNNIPWFEDADIDKPVYEAGEFTDTVIKLFEHFGWEQK